MYNKKNKNLPCFLSSLKKLPKVDEILDNFAQDNLIFRSSTFFVSPSFMKSLITINQPFIHPSLSRDLPSLSHNLPFYNYPAPAEITNTQFKNP